MKNFKFEEILEGLNRALKFCSQLGLEHKSCNSRFAKYKQYLGDLIEIVERNKLGILTAQDNQKLKNNARIYVAALMESMEFGEIIENLSGIDQIFLRTKLEDILQGPELPTDENANSNLSRNTLFELNFASLIKRAGIQPFFAKNPDVSCEINNYNLLFECKRPISKRKIGPRINEGCKQILKVDKKSKSQKNEGVVIISVAGNCGYWDPFIPIDNKELAYKSMDDFLKKIAIYTTKYWGKYDNPGLISGVIFHTRGIFLVGEENRYYGGSWWLGLQFSHVQEGGGFIALKNSLSSLSNL